MNVVAIIMGVIFSIALLVLISYQVIDLVRIIKRRRQEKKETENIVEDTKKGD